MTEDDYKELVLAIYPDVYSTPNGSLNLTNHYGLLFGMEKIDNPFERGWQAIQKQIQEKLEG